MAVRIRSGSKTIICAAKSVAKPDDGYIGDGLHYILAEELKVLSVYGHTTEGADLWQFHEATAQRREQPMELRCLLEQLPWKGPFTIYRYSESLGICCGNGQVVIRGLSVTGAKFLYELFNNYSKEAPDGD